MFSNIIRIELFENILRWRGNLFTTLGGLVFNLSLIFGRLRGVQFLRFLGESTSGGPDGQIDGLRIRLSVSPCFPPARVG